MWPVLGWWTDSSTHSSKHTRHISDLLLYLQGLLQSCQDGDILGKLGSPPGYGPGTSRNPKIKDHSSTLFFHLLLCLLLPVSGTLSSWKWALTRCWGAGVAPVQQDAADIEREVSYLPHRFRFRQLNYSVVEKRSTHFNIGLWNSLKCI